MRASWDLVRTAALVAAFVLAAGCEDDRGGSAPPDRLLDPHEAAALIDEHLGDPNFVVLDVRTPDEYNQGHIEGAVSIDYYGSGFEAQIDALDRGKTYLVYCRRGGRSASAVALMGDLGFGDVYDLDGGMEAWLRAGYPVLPQPLVQLIDANSAAALIDAHSGDQDFVILDVRTAGEFGQGHIAGAVNIDYYAPDFQAQIDALDRTATYLVYCQAGARSAGAATLMHDLGFVEVYDLDGGIAAWIDAGYPVVP